MGEFLFLKDVVFEHDPVILVSKMLGWVSSRLGTWPLSSKNSLLSEVDRLEHKTNHRKSIPSQILSGCESWLSADSLTVVASFDW